MNFTNKQQKITLSTILLLLLLGICYAILKIQSMENTIRNMDSKFTLSQDTFLNLLDKNAKKDESEENEFEKFKMMALETKNLVTESQRPQISNSIKKWRPYTSYIICSWGDPPDKFGSGSGKISRIRVEDSVRILTNKHVLLNDGASPNTCFVTFPEIARIYELEKPNIVELSDGIDAAYIEIPNADTALISLSKRMEAEPICDEGAVLGNSILALGYLWIGTSGDITVTEGIISGFEGDYYISSVKIDHGNSGGIAILVKDNCYLGMPSAAVSGEIESLARILKQEAIISENP